MPRKVTLFDPASTEAFALSRSKVELFLTCRRCFYLDRRLGITRPSSPPYTLNSAVDALLKAEFDAYRARAEPHPLMTAQGLHALPDPHPQLQVWRNNFKGVRVSHPTSGFELFGAVDDLWRDRQTGELIVVDYKSTAKEAPVSLDADWQVSYKRQMEFYQWLLRRLGEPVARRGWFVYCNGRKDLPAFDQRLEFTITLLPHDGDDAWVEDTLGEIRRTLEASDPPRSARDCQFCAFARRAGALSAD